MVSATKSPSRKVAVMPPSRKARAIKRRSNQNFWRKRWLNGYAVSGEVVLGVCDLHCPNPRSKLCDQPCAYLKYVQSFYL